MDIVPVLDLARGRAVHARGGNRAQYRSVESVLAPGLPGDAAALARSFLHPLGARACYAADLDAIAGGSPQHAVLTSLAAIIPALWVDAGVADTARANETIRAGAAIVVVGLETLRSMSDLAAIVSAIGGASVAFSLDLRHGRPMRHGSAEQLLVEASPEQIAIAAAATGAGTIIVLDVARVGSGQGSDLELMRRLRTRLPATRLAAGGGVSGRNDLDRLAELGCDAALVASALHDGRLGARDLAELAGRRRAQSGTSASR